MGLLDDAIREHLELKRRRGADPEEVARQEHEALGRAPQRARRAPARSRPPTARGAAPRRRRAAGRGRRRRRPRARAARRPDRRAGARARAARRPTAPARRADGAWLEDAAERARARAEPPSERRPRAASRPPRSRRARTCSRRRPTSSRRRRSTTGSGSSRSRRATSTSTGSRGTRYTLLDVFTGQPLAGNGLAVVHDADALADATMHAFARETRLSETSFVQTRRRRRRRLPPPDLDDRAARSRSPGHPSLGTAVAVARARGEARGTYVQQTQRGPAADRRRARRRCAPRVSMLQEPAEFGARARPRRRARRSSASTASDADPALPVPGRLHRRHRS